MTPFGRWKNDLGSVIELKRHGKAVGLHGGAKLHPLAGRFTEGTGSDTGRRESFDVIGQAIESASGEVALSFQVVFPPTGAFPHRGSIATWSGRQLSHRGKEKLFTVWILTLLSETKEAANGLAQRVPTDRWNHTLTNADVFTRLK